MASISIKRDGYGQVEPNHLSAQGNRQIYAQLPADENITLLENGQYVKYDYAAGVVDFTGAGEWMMVFNEVKLFLNLTSLIKSLNSVKRFFNKVNSDF